MTPNELEAALAAAELYGKQRDQTESHAERAVQIALYYKLAEYELGWEGAVPQIIGRNVSVDDALRIWLGAVALAAWHAAHSRTKSATRSMDAHRAKKSWIDMAIAEKSNFIDKLVATRVERVVEQLSLPPKDRQSLGSNDSWIRSVARTEATSVSSVALTEMNVLAMGEELGRPLTATDEALLWKVWISRGDSRVRELHRKLHGAPVRGAETPFWSWPTGQQLRWPGDPLAPFGTIVNCRCIHWILPAATQPSSISDVFRPANLDTAFDVEENVVPLAAGAIEHHTHSAQVGDATAEYNIVMSRIRGAILELPQ